MNVRYAANSFGKLSQLTKLEDAKGRGSVAEWSARRTRIPFSRVPLWRLAGFVLGRPEFKSSATLVNSELVPSCQLGFLILLCSISFIPELFEWNACKLAG